MDSKKSFTLGEAAHACRGSLISATESLPVKGISTDSRTIREGDLFFAFRGPHFDGHAFLPHIFQKGAAGAVVSYPVPGGKSQIVVKDPLEAFQELAAWYRRKFPIPVITVTGSAGKTTTKECIAACLSHSFRVRAGFKNWNNHIGVPQNIFALTSDDECAVFETGANHAGEIANLARIAQPTVGVITGIQPAHLEGFGSLEGIYKAKLELADYLDQNGGTLVVNGDNPELLRQVKGRHFSLITYGMERHNDFHLTSLVMRNGFLCFEVNGVLTFRLKGYGAFNALNALAAIAVAGHFNMDLKDLSECWEMLPSIDGRFRVIYLDDRDIQIVDDAYNANPESFRRAVESFQEISGGRRKLVIAGEMRELGPDAAKYHEELGVFLAEAGVDRVIGVGALSEILLRKFAERKGSENALYLTSPESVLEAVLQQIREGDSVLIKGSHGTDLWKLAGQIEVSNLNSKSPTLNIS